MEEKNIPDKLDVQPNTGTAQRNSMLILLAVLLIAVALATGFGLAKLSERRFVNGFSHGAIRGRMGCGNYERGGSGGGMMGNGSAGFRRDRDGMRGGFEGKITKIDNNTLTVTIDNKDTAVLINDNTSIYKSSQIAVKSDIKTDDTIRVMGRPNSSGQIVAVAIIID